MNRNESDEEDNIKKRSSEPIVLLSGTTMDDIRKDVGFESALITARQAKLESFPIEAPPAPPGIEHVFSEATSKTLHDDTIDSQSREEEETEFPSSTVNEQVAENEEEKCEEQKSEEGERNEEECDLLHENHIEESKQNIRCMSITLAIIAFVCIGIIIFSTTTILAMQRNHPTYQQNETQTVSTKPTSQPTPLPTNSPTSPIPLPSRPPAPSTSTNSWALRGSSIHGAAEGSRAGASLSLSSSGTRLAIGAPGYDGDGNNKGLVRVYNFNTTWQQLGSDIVGIENGNQAGVSVSLSGNGQCVAIGSSNSDGSGNRGAKRGHTRIFHFWDGNWRQLGNTIDGKHDGDQSGISISLSNDCIRIAIGAWLNDGNGQNSGHARVFSYNETDWIQLGRDINGSYPGDNAGKSISLSANGQRIAIGSPENDSTGDSSGHVRVFEFSDQDWVQVGKDIIGWNQNDQAGHAVSLSYDGSIVAVGAIWNQARGKNTGMVRVFQTIGEKWKQLGQDMIGTKEHDHFGSSVSISSTGYRVAVGATQSGGSAATRDGYVRVFEYRGNYWFSVGRVLDAEGKGDQMGSSVSMSMDGYMVATGAQFRSGDGFSSGSVYVFEY